ncbi:MAG: DUF3408 domain-containing protein [Rikenellaceae bacterium]|nr:DUF3408 domain-containing protein [Rikenellaceae bacterium]
MGLSDDVPGTSDETGERTVLNEASAHTSPEERHEATGFTIAAPITTDDPEVVTVPYEYDRAASSAPDRGDEILGRAIIPIADDDAAEGSEITVPKESTQAASLAEINVVGVHTSSASPTPPSEQSAPSASATDTDFIRRTAKQRKSDLCEYRATFLPLPKIIDRKPVFISRTTRDRLDRIVRLLGERGMSVSGLVENIALHHLAVHEADIEHWRKM